MSRRILFYCNTPFQIMMAIHLCTKVFNNDQKDIIVSNLIAQGENIYKNLYKTGIFEKIYYLKEHELNCHFSAMSKINRMVMISRRNDVLMKYLPLDEKYDDFFATDTSLVANWTYEYLLRRNRNLCVYYFEEGPVNVLCNRNGQFNCKNDIKGSWKRKCFTKLVCVKNIQGNYFGIYTSVGSQLGKRYFKIFNIPSFGKEEERIKYVDLLNEVWQYSPDPLYKDKIIYFEESFYVDNRPCPDMDIIQDIVEVLGKDNVVVKLHPRTRENRFVKLGIQTNQDSSVPWELIALNGNFGNSVLISLGSGSAIHPQLYWGIKQRAICLVNCKDYWFDGKEDIYFKTFAKLCEERDLVRLPKDRDEFLKIVKELKEI